MKTLEQITEELKASIHKSASEAMEKAYGIFVNECTPYLDVDTISNAYTHASEMIKTLLAGGHVALIPDGVIKYSLGDFKKIRDLIWAENGDAITKKVIEDKDKEIAYLKQWLNDDSRRF